MDSIDALITRLLRYGWYHSYIEEKFRVCVYVHTMNYEVLTTIPATIEGKQIVVHFVSSKMANAEKYTNIISPRKPFEKTIETKPDEDELILSDYSLFLIELEDLEDQCGHEVLEAIFYEVHDGDDAVTNYSMAFPLVRKRIQKLYNTYGFDVIFEEL
jgi:hypothetical protein